MSHRCVAALLFAFALGCSPLTDDEAPDGRDDSFGAGKADGLCVTDGTPAAEGVLALVNDPDIDVDELDASTWDGGVGLFRRAAQGIVDARPIADLAELDAVPYVGVGSCNALAAYACNEQRRCLAPVQAMTWNLEHFPLTSATKDAVVDIVDEVGPDFFGVQEIESTSAFFDVVDRLDGYQGLVGHAGDTRVGFVYRSSAIEVVRVEYLFDHDWYAFPRPVLAVHLRVKDELDAPEIVWLVLHLKALSGTDNEARRRSAIEKLRAWIDTQRQAGTKRIVLAGDLNDVIDDPPAVNVFTALQDPQAGVDFLTTPLADADEFSLVPYQSLIDHMLMTHETSDALVLRSIEVLHLDETWHGGDYVHQVTDHRPVLAHFGVPVGY